MYLKGKRKQLKMVAENLGWEPGLLLSTLTSGPTKMKRSVNSVEKLLKGKKIYIPWNFLFRPQIIFQEANI